jgi:hypothetical protein
MTPSDHVLPGDQLPMTTPVEEPAVTTPAEGQTSKKMAQLLRKRLRQLLRAVVGLAIVLAVAGPIFAIWWLNSLNGLPDIGDPFDVAEFRALRLPEDQNAFTFLRQAGTKLTPSPEWPRRIDSMDPADVWSEADPKLRAWIQANREALVLFLRGADLSDGITRPAGLGYSRESPLSKVREVVNLALLEGARRAEAGDTAGAWECYRGVLRTVTHLRRRGDVYERWLANAMQNPLQKGLATWAADPKTTIPQVRRALDEVIECRPRPEWEAFSLKLSYLDLTRDMDAPTDYVHRAIVEGKTYRLGGLEIPNEFSAYLYPVHRFLKREPERSRRVLRLILANWLAHVEVPELRGSRPAVRAAFSYRGNTSNLVLYPISPQAPPIARAVQPQAVATWLVTTLDLNPFSWANMWTQTHYQELRSYRELVVSLAEELYRRERGASPASDEALVGTYLKALPEDGSAELDDGTAPTVRNAGAVDEMAPK